jgi:hypothetical protein
MACPRRAGGGASLDGHRRCRADGVAMIRDTISVIALFAMLYGALLFPGF